MEFSVLTSPTSTTEPITFLVTTARCPIGGVAAVAELQNAAALGIDFTEAAEKSGDRDCCDEVVEKHLEGDALTVDGCRRPLAFLFVSCRYQGDRQFERAKSRGWRG